MNKLTTLISIVAVTAAIPFAQAGALNESPTQVVVQFGDLDLTAFVGASTLYGRLQSAARLVCGPLEDAKDLKRAFEYRHCVKDALWTAVTHIDQPTLSAYNLRPDPTPR
jgi:UrcA family protein